VDSRPDQHCTSDPPFPTGAGNLPSLPTASPLPAEIEQVVAVDGVMQTLLNAGWSNVSAPK
jgi:hypothetical protein